MTEKLHRWLLEDRWAPVTSELGFLETSAEHAARAFASWQAGLLASRGITVEARPVTGPLESSLSALLPLCGPETRRHLFLPTRGPWTAYTENGWGGTDAASTMAAMARSLSCRGLRVVAVPHTLRSDGGRHGAVMLEVYAPKRTAWLNHLRTVSASHDGSRWVFDQSGEPFAFEKVEQYQARRVRDRFTFDMLEDSLRHLGLSPFDADFYLPEGTCAWLVEKTGPALASQQEYTLAQARERF